MKATKAVKWPESAAKGRPSLVSAGRATLLHVAVCVAVLAAVRVRVVPDVPDAPPMEMMFAAPEPAPPEPAVAAATPALPEAPAPTVTPPPPPEVLPAAPPVLPSAESMPAPALPEPPPTSPEALPAAKPVPPPPEPTPQPRSEKAMPAQVRPRVAPKVTPRARPVPTSRVSEPPVSTTPPPDASASAPASAPPRENVPIAGVWQRLLAAWLAAHKTYPDEARRRNMEGSVVLRFTADRSGRVLDVVLVRSAGSPVFDAAAQAMVRNATLPPFTAGMPQQTITVTVQIRYALAD